MSSTGRRASKYSGTELSPKAIDAAKAIGNHRRDEALKDSINAVKIIAVYATVAAVPVLYLLILCVNWNDTLTRNEWLQKGLVAVIAFALGKVNFNFGDNEKRD
jgi:hypothetical protein